MSACDITLDMKPWNQILSKDARENDQNNLLWVVMCTFHYSIHSIAPSDEDVCEKLMEILGVVVYITRDETGPSWAPLTLPLFVGCRFNECPACIYFSLRELIERWNCLHAETKMHTRSKLFLCKMHTCVYVYVTNFLCRPNTGSRWLQQTVRKAEWAPAFPRTRTGAVK